jgi:FdhD protein
VRRPVERFREGRIERDDDWIASEIPVALHYNGLPHVVMMATPEDLQDFALGFSLSEAIVGSPAELESVEVQQRLEGYEISLRIPAQRAEAVASRQRNLSGRSSCGLCGTQLLEDVVRHPPPVAAGPCIDAAALHRALSALDGLQPLNSRTGATHAAAWAQSNGELMLVREDVGRHNALDKLIGAMATRHIDAGDGFLILTSRASYEMVQKVATTGIGLIAAISAPTALAIHLAESCGVTLIGFARSNGHVIYTHPQRIAATDA